MKSILRQQRTSSILAALVTVALGLTLVIWPDGSVVMLCSILGGALLVSGILYILGFLVRMRQVGTSALMLIPGAVLAGLGIWIMTSPRSVVAMIQYVFGAVVIFHGILDLQGTFSLMGQGARRWWVELLISLLTLGLGLLILVNPFGTFAAMIMLIGVSLMYDGLSDLWIIHRLSQAFRNMERSAQGDVIETKGQDLD